METRLQQDYSVPAEKVCYTSDRRDVCLAVLVGLVVCGGWFCAQLPGLAPDAWQSLCEAAGVRPAMTPRAGLWQLLVRGLIAGLGLARGVAVVRGLGPVAAGLTAAFSYLLLRNLLPLVLRLGEHAYVWRDRVERRLVAAAVVAFSFSAPLGRLAQVLTPDALHFLLAVAGQCLFLRFLQSGRLRFIYACAALAGLLVAETPLGLLLVAFWVVVWLTVPQTITTVNSRLTLWDPVVSACSRWPVTGVFLLTAATGVALDVTQFLRGGGLAANGWDGTALVFGWFGAYGRAVVASANLVGTALALVFGLLPFFVSWRLLPRATDEDFVVGYRRGWIFLVIGAVAFCQLGAVDVFRYLAWSARGDVIASPLLAAVLTFFSLLALVAALVVMGVEIFCRRSVLIVQRRYPETGLSPDKAALLRQTRTRGRVARAVCYWVLPAVLVGAAAVPRFVGGARELRSVLAAAVEATLAESEGVRLVVTDGSFDAGLELASAVQGRPLHALALYAPEGDAYAAALRLRTAADGEDRELLKQSAKGALRTWVEQGSPRLKDLAVQVGFEAWKRVKRTEPRAAGFVARPVEAGVRDASACARDVAAARALAARVQACAAVRRPSGVTAYERDLLNYVQWRLARMARQRAAELDAAGRSAEAADEQALADALDQANVALGALSAQLVKNRLESNTMLTPREGLTIALGRGDFALARRFATPVLVSDPDDPDANFALGMAFLLEEQWARAEEHLLRVLKRKPDEPAVMNNIAAVLLKVGRYDEAEAWARKALARLPDATAVKNTLREVQAARAKAAAAP